MRIRPPGSRDLRDPAHREWAMEIYQSVKQSVRDTIDTDYRGFPDSMIPPAEEMFCHMMRSIQPDIRIDPSALNDFEKFYEAMIPMLMRSETGATGPKVSTYVVLKKKTSLYSNRIFADWERLNSILLRYEGLLRKRWMKKSKEGRKKILLEAYPKIPTMHRPDFQVLRSQLHMPGAPPIKKDTNTHESFLIPMVNLEDLLKPTNLLLLFHSRGHNTPDMFAHADVRTQTHSSKNFNGENELPYTMFLTGRKTPDTYGQMVCQDNDNLYAIQSVQSGIGLRAPQGILVLEAQYKLLRFLVNCAESLLRDLPLDTPAPSIPKQLPLPAPASDTDWPSVAAAAAEAPYREPIQFNFSRLQALVSAKRSEAEDHIWALREDPGYFRDIVGDYNEHQPEVLLQSSRKRHPDHGKPPFWNRVLVSVVRDAYVRFILWDLAWQELKELENIRKRHGSRITTGRLLPPDYDEAFRHFQYLLSKMRDDPLKALQKGIFASPPLRNHYYLFGVDLSADEFRVDRRSNDDKDYFLWLVETLVYPAALQIFGVDNILEEMEYVTRNNTYSAGIPQKDRISAWVASNLSDLAVMSELDLQVAWHQPTIGLLHVLKHETVEKRFRERTMIMSTVEVVLKTLQVVDEGFPLAKFDYPSDKRRSAATTEKMRKAEENLDNFWKIVDGHCRGKTGKTLNDLLIGLLEPRKLERTPEWTQPTTPVTTQVTPKELETVVHDLSIVDIEEQTPESTHTTPAKVKVKTRAQAIDSEPTVNIPQVEPKPPITPKITVSKRAYNVLSLLFHNPMDDKLPGDIPWTDFLHALSSIGFAVERNHGSAWLFTPIQLPVDRPIIFHEPHPSSRIQIQIARRHGRRLERAYGWSSQTFVREGEVD
jgi:hypothetical protein